MPPTMVRIIGVIENVRHGSVQQEPTPEVIFDYRQLLLLRERAGVPKRSQELLGFGFMSIAVRTTGDPALAHAGRARGGDGCQCVGGHRRDGAADRPSRARSPAPASTPRSSACSRRSPACWRRSASTACWPTRWCSARRRSASGWRSAPGSADVIRLVVRHGARLTLVGLALGLAGAAGLSRWLEGLLFGATPLDPETYGMVAVGFALVAVGARATTN